MKTIIAFACLIFVCAVFAAEERYTTKYDAIDIDGILANPRLMTFYVKCLLETGKCNEEGATLKSVIPDALLTNCKKCNKRQKSSVEKVIRFLVKSRKNDWNALIAKYDPSGKYRNNYKQYLEKI